jgi:hypothetical protein
MKIVDFFLFLWVIFALLDPDPQFECGSGSETLTYGQVTLGPARKIYFIYDYVAHAEHALRIL